MWVEHTHRHGWKGVAAVEVPDHGDFADAPDRSTPALAAATMWTLPSGSKLAK